MTVFVVTGTDTGIGKTVFAAGLAGALGACYWKPIQAGVDPEGDKETVAALSGLPADYSLYLDTPDQTSAGSSTNAGTQGESITYAAGSQNYARSVALNFSEGFCTSQRTHGPSRASEHCQSGNRH